MNKPIVGITLLFATGIISGRLLELPLLPVYLSTCGLLILTFLFYLRKRRELVTLFLCFTLFLSGLLQFRCLYLPRSSSHIANFAPTTVSVEIVGLVAKRPELKERRADFILKARRIWICGREEEVEGKIWVRSYSSFRNYNYGDIVRVRGKLKKPGASRKGFSWQRYLSYQGIWVEMNAIRVEVIKRGEGNLLLREAYRSRDWMAKIIDSTLPFPHSSLLKGIMLGDRTSLSPKLQEEFLRTGTGHILVVSGLHVGLILTILLFLFKILGLPPKLRYLLSIPPLVYYAVLTGLRTPVLRATLMATLALFSFLIDRETHPLVILSLAALIILLFSPLSIFTVSFQLSFVTVGGIICLTPYLRERLKELPLRLGEALAVSIAAQISILPLLAFYFNRVPLIGVLTNLLIGPLIAIILALGFLTLALSLVSLDVAQIMANANWLALSILLKTCSFFSFSRSKIFSELACPSTGSFSPWVLLAYYSSLIVIFHFRQLRKLSYFIKRGAKEEKKRGIEKNKGE